MASRKTIPIKVAKGYIPKCADCKFFESEPGEDIGDCHRYPPIAVQMESGSSAFAFPTVGATEWCGEYLCNAN